MELGEIWVKIANNTPLTPDELGFLKRAGNETQQRNSFVAGNTTSQNKLSIELPFFPIYSEVLEKDVASITINIPGGYKHLICMGLGRLTPDGAARDLMCLFNDDESSNYIDNYIYQVGAGSNANEQLTSTGFAVSLFDDGASTNNTGAFIQFIPHYQSSFYKTSFQIFGTATGAGSVVGVEQGVYENVNKIFRIKYFPLLGTENIAKGSVFSVYGIL